METDGSRGVKFTGRQAPLGLRWQSAAATPLWPCTKRNATKLHNRSAGPKSGVALCFPPQSKMPQLAACARLRQADLPYFVVFSKVREGVAKEAPPAQVVEAAEAKFKTLSESRDVLASLVALGYRTRDPQNAAVVVSSYIEKGYTPAEIVSLIRDKGIDGGRFSALSGVMEKTVKGRER